jgi:hypothetical protein
MIEDVHNNDNIEFITKNGEITLDKSTGIYTVWDETYVYTVGETSYRLVADAMLETYARVYLDAEQSTEKEKESK